MKLEKVILKIKKAVIFILKLINPYSPYPISYDFRMSKAEQELFDRAINNSSVYLEFGLGGSTIRVLQKSSAIIYTVDSNKEWINTIRSYWYVRKNENKRLFIHYIDIGETKNWGYPVNDLNKEKYYLFSTRIFKTISDVSLIDTVFVDGRFRVACALKAIQELNNQENVKIMIHDFWDRERYHVLLKFLNPIERAETLGIFNIKRDIDIVEVLKEYELYKHNPE